MTTSREYAKFNRLFVGPRLTRKQRIALMPRMPVIQPTIVEVILTKEELAQVKKRAEWSSYIVERRKKRNRSMPPWADKSAIRAMYFEARRLTASTGIKHEVDHIVPSNHPLVCGLHVETNLQVITEFENITKSNTFSV